MSVVLDGINQYLGNSSAGVSALGFTVSIAFKPDIFTAAHELWSFGDNSTGFNVFNILHAGNVAGDPVRTQMAATANATFYTSTTTTGATSTQWYRATARYPASSIIHAAYLDGTGKGATGHPSADPFNASITDHFVGRLASSLADRYFDGKLAGLCVWNAELSDGTIASLTADANPADVQSGDIVGLWHLLSDGSATTGTALSEFNSPTFDAGDHPYTVFNPALAINANRVIGAGFAA